MLAVQALGLADASPTDRAASAESNGRMASIPVGPILFSRYFNSVKRAVQFGVRQNGHFYTSFTKHELALGAHAEL